MIYHKGTEVICNQRNWLQYTYGERYTVIETTFDTTYARIKIKNDNNVTSTPSLYSYESSDVSCRYGHKNFLTLDEWREKQLKIIN